MDIGISVVPKHSGSEPVGQIRGFPAMLREKRNATEDTFKVGLQIHYSEKARGRVGRFT
jgi:hypothetical protein